MIKFKPNARAVLSGVLAEVEVLNGRKKLVNPFFKKPYWQEQKLVAYRYENIVFHQWDCEIFPEIRTVWLDSDKVFVDN